MTESYRRIPMPERKGQAALELIYDVGNRRASTTSAQRIVRACKILELTPEETLLILQRLEYADHAGNPFNLRIKKVW